MPVTIRSARQGDAAECGRIIFEAFQTLADQHQFPRDFPSVETAEGVASMLMATPGFYDVLAEEDHRIIGVNFVDLRSRIAGVGPIAVDPGAQNKGIGRALMHAVMDVAIKQNAEGIRGVQAITTGPCASTRGWAFRLANHCPSCKVLRSTFAFPVMMFAERRKPILQLAMGCAEKSMDLTVTPN